MSMNPYSNLLDLRNNESADAFSTAHVVFLNCFLERYIEASQSSMRQGIKIPIVNIFYLITVTLDLWP